MHRASSHKILLTQLDRQTLRMKDATNGFRILSDNFGQINVSEPKFQSIHISQKCFQQVFDFSQTFLFFHVSLNLNTGRLYIQLFITLMIKI